MNPLSELLKASMEVPHVDDDGLNLWPYTHGRHATACRFCEAVSLAEMLLLATDKGLTS